MTSEKSLKIEFLGTFLRPYNTGLHIHKNIFKKSGIRAYSISLVYLGFYGCYYSMKSFSKISVSDKRVYYR